MTTLPVDVAALSAEALQSFPAAMLDDPTLWPEGTPVGLHDVVRSVNETIRDNFRSLLARHIGVHIQNAATDMDIAISEDGPLADLVGVWAAYVVGLDLEDFDPVRRAKDWDARIEALKDLVIPLIQGLPAPLADLETIKAYIDKDPRLSNVIKPDLSKPAVASVAGDGQFPFDAPAAPAPVSVRYFAHPESDSIFTTEDGSRPVGDGMVEELDKQQYDAIVARKAAEAAPAAPSFSWDDEDEAPVVDAHKVEEKAALLGPPLPVGDVRPMPLLFHLLEPIGVLLTDVADVTGIAKPTLSNIRNGKRPWGGLTEKQAHKLADELDQRVEAATALSRRLRELDPLVVDGNRA
jgi:plasmid maintenance system antidote protein VapI